MSKIAFILLFSFVSLWAVEYHTYEEARAIQKKNHKIIMLDIVRTNCHYCQDMEIKVFSDPNISKFLDDRFIAVQINLDKEKAPLGIKAPVTPSFYFINKDEEIVKKFYGAWSRLDFKDLTSKVK